jgi:type IV secretion system protein VirB9
MKQAVNHLSVVSHRLLPRTATILFACAVALGFFTSAAVVHAQPITSDSRIKTFVYNPNEVFSITTHYGYQSNIEFAQKESIETISVGDRVAWQIIPAGRRLFIRAMEENARTNMTVVTNLRAYQFELRSSAATAVFGSESLTYVVRFFYPTEALANGAAPVPAPLAVPVAQSRDLPPPLPTPVAAPAPTTPTIPAPEPVITQPVMPPTVVTPTPAPAPPAPRVENTPQPQPQLRAAAVAPTPAPLQPAPPATLNYQYTFSGPNDIAPTKIYDDGKTTYFKLPSQQLPKFAILTAAGAAIDVPARRTRDGLVAVDAVAQSFRLKQAGRDVVVYNEAAGGVN